MYSVNNGTPVTYYNLSKDFKFSKMKIKIDLFEKVTCCTLLPGGGIAIATALLIFSLITKQDPVVYKGIVIIYVGAVLMFGISLSATLLFSKRTKMYMVISEGKIEYSGRTYFIDNITNCVYYVCKWYAIPLFTVYKQQAGGLMTIKFNDGNLIAIKIFYKDYLQIRQYIRDIELK